MMSPGRGFFRLDRPVDPCVGTRVKCAAVAVILLALAGPIYAETDDETEAAVEDSDIGSYGLDDIERTVSPKGKVKCPDLEMVRYAGDVIRYHKPVKVYVGFRDRLEKFEKIVEETAIEVYGRKPKLIRHIGTYNCRRIRRYPDFLSEHALGNGIDIESFEFERARGVDQRSAAPDKQLRGGFKVTVEKHWGKTKGVNAIHAEFLKKLTDRLIDRDDVFRVLLGPAFPGHKNHFHFDCAPWRIVEI